MEARGWLERLNMERIDVTSGRLKSRARSGQRFGSIRSYEAGILDDAFECDDDARLADEVMTRVSLAISIIMRPLLPSVVRSAGGKRAQA